MSARAAIHAMFPLDETAEQELNARLDALVDETLTGDGQDYPGELDMLRGLIATVSAVAEHGDLPDVRRLLAEYAADDKAARAELTNPDFFKPGHTYCKGQDGYKAPEQTWTFHCVAVSEHPREGAGRRAFGFMRQGLGQWESAGVREGEFQRGWVDIAGEAS